MNRTKKPLTIRPVHFDDSAARERLLGDLDRFLGPYSDPRAEMIEAVQEAEKNGFIVEALGEGNHRLGLLVITLTPFSRFQPCYHLAYIASAPEARGQGVGKALLAEARRLTGDQIALHVSPSNERAVAFYEKLGWKVKYLRMMPGDSP